MKTLLAQPLCEWSALEHLDLSSNFVCKDASESLLRLLTEKQAVEELDETVSAQWRGLLTLNLRDNLLPQSFAEQLLELLKQDSTTLMRVSLEKNQVRTRIIREIEELTQRRREALKKEKMPEMHEAVQELREKYEPESYVMR